MLRRMGTTHAASGDEIVLLAEGSRVAGVSVDTLRRYGDRGYIELRRTPGGHRRVLLSEMQAIRAGTLNTSGTPADE